VTEISSGKCDSDTDAAAKKYFGIFFSIFQTSMFYSAYYKRDDAYSSNL
jgi:hypothetical protein